MTLGTDSDLEPGRVSPVVLVLKACIPLLAIVGLVVLDIVALCHGINGSLLLAVVGAVCTLAGVSARDLRDIIKRSQERRRSR